MTRTRRTATNNDMHRAWLELVDTDGPFLALPVLKRIWPQGMPQMDAAALAALKDARPAWEKAWEQWDRSEAADAAERYQPARDQWVETVLCEVFSWQDSYVTDLGHPALA